MNRRNFLKLLGLSPVVPSVLMAKTKKRSGTRKLTDKEIAAFQKALTEVVNKKMMEDGFYREWREAMSDLMLYGQGTMKIEDGKYIRVAYHTVNYCYGSSPVSVLF